MKMHSLVLGGALLAAVAALAPHQSAQAFDCYIDPVYARSWTGQVKIGARVRDGACMDNTTVLTTLPVGTTVNIIAETDGWLKVKLPDGTKGWVGATLISVTSRGDDNGDVISDEKAYADPSTVTKIEPEPTLVTTAPTPTPTSSETTATLTSRLKGYILLDVQNHGEAWYVNPEEGKRYYMKDGPTAYEMMRQFGLGISEADFTKLQSGNADLLSRLKGKIVLRVQQHGEAYYIHPVKKTINYLQNGDEAYRVMRELSLGITGEDLAKITSRDFGEYVQEREQEREAQSQPSTDSPTNESTTSDSAFEVSADIQALNEYWLAKINALRAEKGLRQLVIDNRWIKTASEWATYMGENNVMTHDRPDGKTMHQWIDTKGLPFTVRYSDGGWQTNYFTENISYGYADGSLAQIESVLDDSLALYLSEASSNGAHYRTIYHPDWNSVGMSVYLRPDGGRYKVFVTFHYGSLVL